MSETWTLWPEINRAYPARAISVKVVSDYRHMVKLWPSLRRFGQYSLMRRVFPWRPSYVLRGDPLKEILVADPVRREQLVEFVISQTIAYDG